MTHTIPFDAPNVKHPYFQTPCYLSWKAIQAKFTGADWAIWQYIQMTDPFGEGRSIIDIPALVENLSLSAKQIHRSLNKLKEYGFYEWVPQQIRGRNLAPKYLKVFQDSDKSVPDSDKSVPDSDKSVLDLDKSVPDSDKSVLDLDKSVPARTNLSEDIYIDRARVQTSYQTSTNNYKQLQTCAKEAYEPAHTHTITLDKVENLKEEESIEVFSPIAPGESTAPLENKNLQLDKCSAPPLVFKNMPQVFEKVQSADLDIPFIEPFSEKMENLVMQLDRGELCDLPITEKKQLANYLMGDKIKLYRRNGWILAIRANDINPDFLRYVAWKELKQPDDLEWARNTVVSYERDMSKWGQLVSLVQGWQTVTPEEVSATAIARVAAKRGGKEDLEIAIQSSIDDYKNLKNNPFRRKA